MDLLAWFRRPSAAAGPAPAPVVRRPEWPQVPPVQRVVEPPSLITDPAGFRAGLSTWADPSLHGPPGHLVSATAPSGLGHGLAAPVPADRMPAPQPKPAVQRKPVDPVRGGRLASAAAAPVPPPARLPAIPLQRAVTDASPAEADLATTDEAPEPAEAEPAGPADVAGPASDAPPPEAPPVGVEAPGAQTLGAETLGAETPAVAGNAEQRSPDPPPAPRRIGLGAPVQRLPESARPAPPPPPPAVTGDSVLPSSRAGAPRIGPPVSRLQAASVQRAADGSAPRPADPLSQTLPAPAAPLPQTPGDRETASEGLGGPADVPQPVQRTLGAAELDGRDGQQTPGDAGRPVQRMPIPPGVSVVGGLGPVRGAVPTGPPGGGSVQRDSRDPVEWPQPVPRNGAGPTAGATDVGAEPLVPRAATAPVQRTLGAPLVDERPGGSPVQRAVADPGPAAWPGSVLGGGGLDTGRRWGAVPARPPGDGTRAGVQVSGSGGPVQRAAVDSGAPLGPVGPGDVRVQRVSDASAPGERLRPLDPVGAGTRLVVARFPEPARSVAPEAAVGTGLIGDRPIAPAPPAVPAVEAPGESSVGVVSTPDGSGAPSLLDHRVVDVSQAPVVSRIIRPEPSAPTEHASTEHAPVPQAVEHVVVSRAVEAEPAAEPVAAEPVAAEPVAAPVAPGGPGAPAAPGGSTSATEVDALVGRIYDPLVRRLKAELRLERERAGHVLDLRL